MTADEKKLITSMRYARVCYADIATAIHHYQRQR